jgi:hypothetical protein
MRGGEGRRVERAILKRGENFYSTLNYATFVSW